MPDGEDDQGDRLFLCTGGTMIILGALAILDLIVVIRFVRRGRNVPLDWIDEQW